MKYRRKEPRFESDQPVTVTNLEQPGVSLTGRLVNFSACGTRMILKNDIAPGTMVKVDLGGTILLGEIIYSSPEAGEYAVGLELEDALYEAELLEAMTRNWAVPAQEAR